MTRRPVLVALSLVAVASAGLAALAIWRVPLAQSLLDWAVEDLDIPAARARVESITGDRIRLTDLAAGDQAELTVGRIEVAFHLPEVLRGRIDGVSIDDLALRLDLRDGAAPLGSLQPWLDRVRQGGETNVAPPPIPLGLPDVTLNRGRVTAETSFGAASLTFDGTLAGHRQGGPALDLQGRLTSAWAQMGVALSASGDPQHEARAHLVLSRGAVRLPEDRLRIDDLTGDLDVSVADGRPQSGHGKLAARGLAVAGTPFDQAQANFDLSRDQAGLSARLSSDDGSFDLALDGRGEALDGSPRLTLALRSEIGESAPVWALSPPPFPAGGSGHIELDAAGAFAALPPIGADSAVWKAWLAAGTLSGKATGGFERLSLPGVRAEAAARLDLDALWSGGELRLTTRPENRVAATGITAADLAGLGLPPGLAEELTRIAGGRLSVSLPAPAEGPTALVWRRDEPARDAGLDGSVLVAAGPVTATLIGRAEAALAPTPALTRVDFPDVAISAAGVAIGGQTIDDLRVTGAVAGAPEAFEASGELAGRLGAVSLAGAAANAISLRLPFQASRDGESFGLALAGPGRVTVTGLEAAGLLRAEDPVDITVAGAEARLTPVGEDGGFALSHKADIGVAETRLLLQSGDEAPIPLTLRLPDLTLDGELGEDGRYSGKAQIRGGALTLPGFDLALEGLAADLTLPVEAERATARFTVAAARHLASPAAVQPLALSGSAERRGDRVELTARVDRPDGEPLAKIAARHDLASGAGQADVTLLPLRFAPGGLQPVTLSPRFAGISDARGRAEGAAALAWDPDGLTGTAHLTIRDLSFSGPGTTVSGLDLDLELDHLQPPTSPPDQRLSADVIDVGVPLKDLEARFRLPPDAPGRILLEEASFATVGSHLTLRNTLIDPTGERLDTQLSVDRLDVGALFEVLAIDGLSGSGVLSGTIPIKREGDQVIIEDARLTAGGPGVLRFRSDAAARALAGGGEQVDLVIKALQDFHYQTLTLTGNLDRTGEARLRLEILGNNPQVLDGYPFQLNINLTGNPTPILEVLKLSRTLIQGILQRARRLSQ